MFEVNNEYQGASFNYENDACNANGDFRRMESVLSSVNINGTYVKDGTTYSFWASRDANGNINISGVPSSVIIAITTEVVAIIEEIEALNEDND